MTAETAERPAPGRWHILTGEYPPQPGGVSDYSERIAHELARAGAEVHVWAPSDSNAQSLATTELEGGSVEVHRADGIWSPRGLTELARQLDAFPGPRRLLAQYTPNAWGMRGLNVGFCRWLAARGRRGDDVRIMFHELRYPFWLDDRPTRWVLAATHQVMLRVVLRGASGVYYANERWGRMLRKIAAARGRPLVWLPVPSTVPAVDDPAGVAEVRSRVAPGHKSVVGHFGTFRYDINDLLRDVLPPLLLGRPDRVGLLIGRNGPDFAADLVARHPELAEPGRVVATGGLDAPDVSRHLQACDLMAQPYPGGVCTRRTTVMAALAHGLATVTNVGPDTEAALSEGGALALAPDGDPAAFAAQAERLLSDPSARAALGAAARRLYDQTFAPDRIVATILGDPAGHRRPDLSHRDALRS